MPAAKKKPAARRSDCPLNTALEVFGDQWSLLIVRDLMFKCRNTYAQFLEGGENIATNILANRLQRLEEAGIVTKSRHASDRRRHVYQLTSKGADLAPVLVEMIIWADHYHETAAPPAVVRRMKTQRRELIAELRANAKRKH